MNKKAVFPLIFGGFKRRKGKKQEEAATKTLRVKDALRFE
jgi:hypothetical protein